MQHLSADEHRMRVRLHPARTVASGGVRRVGMCGHTAMEAAVMHPPALTTLHRIGGCMALNDG